MTTDDILRMALEADALANKEIATPGGVHTDWHDVRDRHFAALVAAAEREECAKVCEYRAMALDHSGNQYVRDHAALDCARSIRARGRQPSLHPNT